MAETPVRQRKTSASRKEQLLAIAAKVFAEQGYKETGIESILKQAGLSGPALYRHFSSKQEILDTICIDTTQRDLKSAWEVRSDSNLTAEEMLRKLIHLRIDYLFGPTGDSAILPVSQKAHLSDAARARVVALQREFRTICGEMLKKIRPRLSDEEIEVRFFATQNLLLFGVWRARTRRIVSETEHRDILEKIVWNNLLEQ